MGILWTTSSFALLLPIIICIIKDIIKDHHEARLKQPPELKTKTSAAYSENVSEIEMKSLLNAHSLSPSLPASTGICATPSNSDTPIIEINSIRLVIFNAFIMICYILIRITAITFDLRRDYKFLAIELQDIYDICLKSTIIFIFGGICNRNLFEFKRFLLHIIGFAFMYTIVFQFAPEAFQLSPEMGLNGLILIILLFVLIIAIYLVQDNIIFARNCVQWRIYFFTLFAALFVYHLVIVFSGNENIQIHIHHHHWSFLLCLFLHSPKLSSFAAQAMLIGIFIHGIAVFGNEPWYQWNENAANDFGLDECQKWQCARFKCELPKG